MSTTTIEVGSKWRCNMTEETVTVTDYDPSAMYPVTILWDSGTTGSWESDMHGFTLISPAPAAAAPEPVGVSNWDKIRVGERWGLPDDRDPWHVLAVSAEGIRVSTSSAISTGSHLRSNWASYLREDDEDSRNIASWVRHPDAPEQPKAHDDDCPGRYGERCYGCTPGVAAKRLEAANEQPKAVEPAAAKYPPCPPHCSFPDTGDVGLCPCTTGDCAACDTARAAKPVEPPKAKQHRFDPYCVEVWRKQNEDVVKRVFLLCVDCGSATGSAGACEPSPGWRAEHEARQTHQPLPEPAAPAPRVLPYDVGNPWESLYGLGSGTCCPVRSRRPR